MQFDFMDKVLLAMYIEQLKKSPSMDSNVRPGILEISQHSFITALKEFEKKEYILGVSGTENRAPSLVNVIFTTAGIDSVERKYGITSGDKLSQLYEDSNGWEWSRGKSIVKDAFLNNI